MNDWHVASRRSSSPRRAVKQNDRRNSINWGALGYKLVGIVEEVNVQWHVVTKMLLKK